MTDECIWDYYQSERPEVFGENRPRLAYLLGWVKAPSRVLNIGVGNGALEELALERGLMVSSLDPSPQAIEGIRKRLGLGERAKTGLSQEIPFSDHSFEAVVISEVLEHLDDAVLEKTVKEIERVLVPGGLLIGSVPANEDLAAEEAMCPECGHRFHRWGHRQSFTAARLASVLESRFEVRHLVVKPFFSWSRLNWKGRISALAKGILAGMGCHGANESICFVAARR